jgi:hypothetical protein
LSRVILGEPFWSCSGSTASSPNRSLKGVHLVALLSDVLCDHVTEVSSSAHLSFGLPWSFLEMPWRMMSFALSTSPFDCGSLTDAKHILVPI